ncbi:OmpA family protein [Gangjinia marincola]|uniref:OmpA family protein n=1 Tax=Gangjinia marincola TaxID=578463 RepID=A0ABP3XTZ5_9FLAO
MKYITTYVLLALLIAPVFLTGQNVARKIKPINQKYDRLEYADAIIYYEEYLKKGYKNEDLLQRLGNSYYFTADLLNAERIYTQLFNMNPEQEPDYLYRYAQSLRAAEKYDEANQIIEELGEDKVKDIIVQEYREDKDYVKDILRIENTYKIKDAGFNSSLSDFAATFMNDHIVFSSNRAEGIANVKIHKWNNQPFLDLYMTKLNESGVPTEIKALGNKVNTKFHESTSAFSKDGKYMYFTRNNYFGDEYKKSENGVNLLKLFRATNNNGKWVDIKELSFNSNEYSVAHPALSPDGKRLYFASDMPGTIGQSDIYYVTINDDGSYGDPQNLGAGINTEGKESFPFISNDGTIYFSSTGHPGIGGFDIFYTETLADDYTEPRNVGRPVNSNLDDFAFVVNDSLNIGFFSSNREGGAGDDDIYSFERTQKLVKEEIAQVDSTAQDTAKVTYRSGDKLSNYFDFEEDEDKIFFEYDKSRIRTQAKPKLNKILAILKENPEIELRIVSHTDIRGTNQYNEALSERRAKSTKDYLVENGIDAGRLGIDWKGETQPAIRCAITIGCSEKEHLMNRRSEFYIR